MGTNEKGLKEHLSTGNTSPDFEKACVWEFACYVSYFFNAQETSDRQGELNQRLRRRLFLVTAVSCRLFFSGLSTGVFAV